MSEPSQRYNFRNDVEALKQQLREQEKKAPVINYNQNVNTRAHLEILLEKLEQNEYFKESKPPIDIEFLLLLSNTYSVKFIREELNKMYAWLKSNPGREKTNYRRFITNWLSGAHSKNSQGFKK